MKLAIAFIAGLLLGAALVTAPRETPPPVAPVVSDTCAWALNSARATIAASGCEDAAASWCPAP